MPSLKEGCLCLEMYLKATGVTEVLKQGEQESGSEEAGRLLCVGGAQGCGSERRGTGEVSDGASPAHWDL